MEEVSEAPEEEHRHVGFDPGSLQGRIAIDPRVGSDNDGILLASLFEPPKPLLISGVRRKQLAKMKDLVTLAGGKSCKAFGKTRRKTMLENESQAAASRFSNATAAFTDSMATSYQWATIR
jgi:hypothetical protein